MLYGELRRQQALYASADAAAMLFAVGLAWLAHKPFGDFCPLKPAQWTATLLAGAIVLISIWVASARAMGLYQPRRGRVEELLAIIRASALPGW